MDNYSDCHGYFNRLNKPTKKHFSWCEYPIIQDFQQWANTNSILLENFDKFLAAPPPAGVKNIIAEANLFGYWQITVQGKTVGEGTCLPLTAHPAIPWASITCNGHGHIQHRRLSFENDFIDEEQDDFNPARQLYKLLKWQDNWDDRIQRIHNTVYEWVATWTAPNTPARYVIGVEWGILPGPFNPEEGDKGALNICARMIIFDSTVNTIHGCHGMWEIIDTIHFTVNT
jgi:hypothetical protein